MNDLVPSQSRLPTVQQELTVEDLIAQVVKIQTVMEKVMRVNEHYGVIPGTGTKPTLLKAGAEKLLLLFRLDPEYQSVESYDGPHLTVKSVCTLFHIPTGQRMGSGEAMCSTRESKYAFRQGQRLCPKCRTAAIIKGKEEYGGGWLCFAKRGGCGAKFADADTSITSQEVGRVQNQDLADSYNTVLKMGNKRALIAAVLNVTAASDIFTQDLEDYHADEPKQETPKAPAGNGKPSDHYEIATDLIGKVADISGWRALRDRVWASDKFTPEQRSMLDTLLAKRSCELMRAAKDEKTLADIGDACAAASAERAFSESAIAEMNATYQEQLAKLETPAEPTKPAGPPLALHSQVSEIDAWLAKLAWGEQQRLAWVITQGAESVAELTMEQAAKAIEDLKGRLAECSKPKADPLPPSPRMRAEKALREADTIEQLNVVREQIYASAKNLKKHFDDLDSIYGERATEFLGVGGTAAWEKILASHHKHSLPAKISNDLDATYAALQAAQEVPT